MTVIDRVIPQVLISWRSALSRKLWAPFGLNSVIIFGNVSCFTSNPLSNKQDIFLFNQGRLEWSGATYKIEEMNRALQSVVFNSGRKMALRAFYFIRTVTKALTYNCINRSERHLLVQLIGKAYWISSVIVFKINHIYRVNISFKDYLKCLPKRNQKGIYLTSCGIILTEF